MKIKRLVIILLSVLVSACGGTIPEQAIAYEPVVVGREGEIGETEAPAEQPAVEMPDIEEAVEPNRPQPTSSGAIAQHPLPTPAPTMAVPGNVEIVSPPQPPDAALPPDAMFFEDYRVNPFVDTYEDHLSTFALDVDTAS